MAKESIPILLIEDNPTDVVLLREALEEVASFSFQLTVAERLEQGLELLGKEPFEAVLLDLGLPDSQGLDTFQKVHKQQPDMPTIVLSGMEDEGLAFEAVQAGAQDYMVKGKAGGESIARAIRYAIERQRSQTALRESENRFRSLFEHSPVAYQSLDAEGCFIDVNEQFCEMLGYEPRELLGKSFGEFWSPETRSSFPRKFATFTRDGETNAEVQLLKKDGAIVEAVLAGKTQYDLNGQIIRMHCILHDITERVLAEQAIRESQERFVTVFRASPISIFITTTDETIIDVNEAFLDMFGYDRGQVLGRTTSELNLWHDLRDRNQLVKLLGSQGDVSHHEIKFRASSGEIGDALAFVELIELAGKQCMLIMLNDVTEGKQAEGKLKQSEEKYRSLFDNMIDGFALHEIILDKSGKPVDYKFLEVNDAFERMTNLTKENILGKNVTEALPGIEKDPAEWINRYGQVALTGQEVRFEQHAEPLGRWYSVLAYSPQRGQFATIFTDITEHKQADTALRESEEKYRTLVENAPVGIFQSTPGGHYLNVNPKLAHLFGYDSSHQMIMEITDIATQIHVDPSKREEFKRRLAEEGQINDFVNQNYRKDGSIIWTSTDARVVKDNAGNIHYYEGFMTDITDHLLEEERQSHRAEELAALQATVLEITAPHDLPDLLQAIVERAANLLGADGGGLYLCDAERQEVTCVVSINTPRDYTGTVLKYGEGAAGTVAQSGQALLIDDYRTWSGRAASFEDESPFRAICSTPMTWDSRVTGVLHVLRSSEDDPFSQADLELLTLFAIHAAIAMENTSLVQKLQLELAERKQAEQALLVAEEKYRTIFDEAVEGIFQSTPEGRFITVNPALARMWGYESPEEMIATIKDISRQVYADSHQRDEFKKLMKEKGEVHGFEYQALCKDKEVLWVSEDARAVRDASGKLLYYEGNIQDISARKAAEEELKENEEKFSKSFYAHATAMQIIDLDMGKRVEVNKSFLEITEYTREELTQTDIYSLNLWKDPTAQKDALKKLVKDGMISAYPMEALTKSGGTKHILLSAAILELEGKNLAIESLVDITGLHRTEQALRKSEERFRLLFENLPIGVYRSTPEGKILAANPAFAQMLGYPNVEELMAVDVLDIFIEPDDRAQELSQLEDEGDIHHFKMQLKQRDGNVIWVRDTFRVVRNNERQILYFEGSLENITEQERAEESERDQRTLAEALRETAETLNRNLDYGSVLERILSITGRVVPNDTATVILIEDGKLHIAGSHGYKERGLSAEKTLSELNLQEPGNLKEIFESRKPVAIPDVSAYPHWKTLPGTEWLRSNVGAPLIVQDNVIGFILLDSEKQGFFTPLHAQRLQAFANQAALAIENARLYKETQQLATFNRNIIQSMAEGIVLENGDGIFTFANPAALKLLGYTSEELLGKHWKEVIPADQYAIVQAADERRQRGETDRYEVELLHKDGQRISILVSGSPQFDAAGEFTGTMAVFSDVTDLKRAEERFRIIFESAPDAYYLNDLKGTFVDGNIAAARLMGYEKEEMIGRSFLKLNILPKNQLPKAAALLARNAAGKPTGPDEFTLTTKGGKKVEVEVFTHPVRIEGETLVLGIARDVTARKQAENLLRESERLLRESQLIAGLGNYVLDIPTGIWKSSEILDGIFGIDEAYDRSFEGWAKLVHPDDRQGMVDYFTKEVIGKRIRFDKEYKIVRNEDKAVRWVHGLGELEVDDQNQLTRMHGTIQDITERKLAEEKLIASESELRALFAGMTEVVIVFDVDGHYVKVAPTNHSNLYRSAEEMLGKTLHEILPEEQADYILARVRESVQSGQVVTGEYCLQIDGEEKWRSASFSPLSESTAILVAHDITPQKQVEMALQRAEQRYRGLFEEAPAMYVITHNVEGSPVIADCNELFSRTLGFSRDELLGQPVAEFYSPASRVQLLEGGYQRALAGEFVTEERELLTQDGRIVPTMVRSVPEVDASGGVTGTRAMFVDISERKQAEAEIKRHVTELETLYENGLLISGLLEPKKIAKRIVEVLGQNMHWHHIAIRQYHEENDQLELLAFSQPNLNTEELEQHAHRLDKMINSPDHGLSGWVVRHNRPFRSGNLSEEPHYVDTFPGLKSGLYVPIQSGDVTIGSIAVESEEEDAFTEQDERLLITLSNQAAISFENAKLYSRLQKELGERRQAEDQVRKLNIELEQRVASRTEEIEAAHQRMELAAAAAGIGVWELKSPDDKFFWDKRMHSIYGTTSVEFQPTLDNWLDLIYSDDREMVKEKHVLSIEQGTSYENEYRIIRADGSLRYISSHAIVLTDEKHEFTDMIGVNMDITAIKQAEETLRMANAELERALRVKDEFLANMSHELRTPLNAILGLSESLEEQIAGPLNEKQQKYIHTIGESGHHLLTLINDILDLAKIEAGQIVLDINKVNVQLVCQASIRMVTQLAQKKEQDVRIEIDENVNLIWADERRLKQMIVNLLSNAVKFTPQGGKLGISVDADQSDNTVLITVWDTGIGIKDEDMQRLFQPFVQLDASLDRESPGTGLGLTLVAQMTRLHGGRMAVDSSPGEGSRFTIILPWKPAIHTGSLSKRQTGELGVNSTPSVGTRHTILLVEDTDAVVMMLKDYLESAGYQMVVARDGLEGIDLTRRLRPDLVLMDVMMPGLDGLEATRRIRSEPAFANTPIIGLTALAMSSDRERCLAAGMNDYMSKPVKLDELLSVVQSYLPPNEETQSA